MVVPVGTVVKLVDPNREPDVPPNGLEAVFVVPNNPPLLVLVPKSAKQDQECHQGSGRDSKYKNVPRCLQTATS